LARAAPLLLLVVLASAPSARAQEAAGPFALSEWRVPGRAIDAFVARDEGGRERVLVISVLESAPQERRYVSFLPVDRSRAASPVELPPAVVAVDAAELGLAPGPELVWLSAGELRVVSASGETLRSEPIDPPLPLPARTWELARSELVQDWDSDGRLEALLPSAAGARLHPLAAGDTAQTLALPLIADYGSPSLDNWFRPGFLWGLVSWPMLSLADDDGDGRKDLYAANRFELLVFRAGPQGLPSAASTRRPFPPFTPDEERRHTASTLLAFARDLDGDGRAELVVHRMVGNLMRSHATTTVHENGGDGPDPRAAPRARLESKGGTSAIELEDVDGDGRVEVLEAHIPFGVVQAVRMLTLGRLEVRLRVRALPTEAGAPALETWRDDVTFPFDYESSRVLGLMPHTKTDWNGDGLRDLCWGDGSGKLRFRLGEARAGGPGYGAVVATLELPVSGDLVSADLDADGLPDLVAHDPLDLEGRVRIGINRGALPGTPAGIRAAPEGP
jgi:hypothetical protein